jgi:hypothetical protein
VNTTANNLRIPWFSLGFLLVLVALAPCAMSFRPYALYTTDSLHPYRVALVLLGLTATVAAFTEFITTLHRTRSDIIALAPFAAGFLACAVVGWRSYPYWATGVYQVDIGAFPPMDQDPKGLIPMVWIGDLWRLPVVLLYPLCYIAVPLLVLVSLLGFWRRQIALAGVTVVCTAGAHLRFF